MMNKTTAVFALVLCLQFMALASDVRNLEGFGSTATEPDAGIAANIRNIQELDEQTGFVYTPDAIFRTDDAGRSWYRVQIPLGLFEVLSAVEFADRNNAVAIAASEKTAILAFMRTTDGGRTWQRHVIDLPDIAVHEAAIHDAEIAISGTTVELAFRLMTSSNFTGRVRYASFDGGETWQFVEKRVEPRTADEPLEKRSGDWTLRTEGTCAGYKSGCVQETKLFASEVEITPPAIIELARIAKEKARSEATPMFAAPPGGATRISLNRGFDQCVAGTVAQMQLWWDNSPHHNTNIYMSGRARACPNQPFTNNPAWIDAVSAQGWGLIPTIVGYQAPCSVSTTPHKHSSDPVIAEQQGQGEATIAVNDAVSIGLTTGSVLYYDMERYNDTGDMVCRNAVKAFLKGWTDRVHQLGYISGVYGSPTNAVEDWIGLPIASRMDAVWLARWDNVMSVWTYNSPSPVVPTNVWNNHQRIKQWQAPHNETWGGVTFNIDGNILDGPVAGIPIPKNRRADFDGDRKSDISVFRPDTGVWYVQKSNGSGYIIIGFGLSTDVLAPGDFDGDGKTDLAVFRPSDGSWHTLGKANLYSARAFGANGDIPAPADYNGDGKADHAVFRPSNGVWYIANSDSMGTFTIMQFGLSGDVPVTGDYDGDGKADIAVWRPSSGVWYVSRSSDGGVTATAFGLSTDRPSQGDYDGDGKTDLAVLRDGTWYLLQTTAGFSQFNFGVAGDVPSTGDFDGDGKDDAAVFRPSNGVWYLLQSTNGFYAQQFGTNGDRSVTNAYLPQ